jgi:hypothetical protein
MVYGEKPAFDGAMALFKYLQAASRRGEHRANAHLAFGAPAGRATREGASSQKRYRRR